MKIIEDLKDFGRCKNTQNLILSCDDTNVNVVAKTLNETRLNPLTDEVNDTELAYSFC